MVTETDRALEFIAEHGLLRACVAVEAGVSATTLSRLVAQGKFKRIAPGVYESVERQIFSHTAVLAVKYPKAVICLLSALDLHGLTTQIPRQVWMAIGNKSAEPHIEFHPIRIVRMSEELLTKGIVRRDINGVAITLTDPARSIADSFKFRNKIGTDVAIEALRGGWDSRRVTMDELWAAAEQTRMMNVMRPYLESLI